MPGPDRVAAGLLRAGWVDRPVSSIELETVSEHVCRAHIRYDAPCHRIDGRNPDTVVVKWKRRGGASVAVELAIYERLSSWPGVAAPRAAALIEEDGTASAILLADVGVLEDFELDSRAARTAVDCLARMHAHFWEVNVAGLPEHISVVPPAGWAERVGAQRPDQLDKLRRGARALDNAVPLPTTIARTVVHGDPTRGNVLLDQGRIRFIDWGAGHRGPGVVDLAMLVIGSVEVQVRTHHEWELVLRYHSGLLREGVSAYSLEECWRHYGFAKAEALRSAIGAWAEDGSEARVDLVVRCCDAVLGEQGAAAA